MSEANALAPGEASLHIKVYRTDGTVEELEGLPSIDYEAVRAELADLLQRAAMLKAILQSQTKEV